MDFFTAPTAIKMGFQSPFRPLVIDLKSLYRLSFVFILNFILRIVNIFNAPFHPYEVQMLQTTLDSLGMLHEICNKEAYNFFLLY